MFFELLKLYARLAIRIYCPEIRMNKPELLKAGGPLLLAANHPNSFLDGIILNTIMEQPVFALARGDVFKRRLVARILQGLRLLPVYRQTEGVENLGNNYVTFSACQKVFEQKGIVLIFSEGDSINEWHLRPLGKGTARLATTAWQNGLDLTVLPLGINYNSFKRFGKKIHLKAGERIDRQWVMSHERTSQQLLAFNEQLRLQLSELVYEIDPDDENTRRRIFRRQRPNLLLLVPAFAGWLLHAPFFYPVKALVFTFFKSSDHYDSVLVALLMVLYPLYLIALVLLTFLFIGWPALLFILIMPLLAALAVRTF